MSVPACLRTASRGRDSDGLVVVAAWCGQVAGSPLSFLAGSPAGRTSLNCGCFFQSGMGASSRLAARMESLDHLHPGNVSRAIRKYVVRSHSHKELGAGKHRHRRVVGAHACGAIDAKASWLLEARKSSPTAGLARMFPKLLNIPFPS